MTKLPLKTNKETLIEPDASPLRDSTTVVFAPFTSAQAPSNPLLAYFLQGIKSNPYQANSSGNDFLMTGTSGSPVTAGGIGAVYLGAIDGLSTTSGSGSGGNHDTPAPARRCFVGKGWFVAVAVARVFLPSLPLLVLQFNVSPPISPRRRSYKIMITFLRSSR